MTHELKKRLMNNKNDLVKGTFCYSLFEEDIFDIGLIEVFIKNVDEYISFVKSDFDIKNLLIWVCRCVDQCFVSHHDKYDYFVIKNYTSEIENRWIGDWKPRIKYKIEEIR